jgi:hypothetical protein
MWTIRRNYCMSWKNYNNLANPLLFSILWVGVYKHKEQLSSEEVLKLLEDLSFENFDDTTHLDHYQFGQILDLLYSRNDYDIVRGANIEMKYIFIFTNSDSHFPKIYID